MLLDLGCVQVVCRRCAGCVQMLKRDMLERQDINI